MTNFLEHLSEARDKGSTMAFFHLVQLFEHKVFTLCFRIIRNREEAEEAAQDTFLKCFRNLKNLKEPEKFPQWLLRIAYTKSIDIVRKKKVIKVSLEDIGDLQSDLIKVESEKTLVQSDYLDSALKMLDPQDAAIINLYYLEDFQVKEIAGILDLSESNVKIRLYRARNEIREKLEPLVPVSDKEKLEGK